MRADGTRVKDLTPIVQALPYIMPKRYDAQNWASDYVDEDVMKDYIRRKRREGRIVTHMSVLVAAYYKAALENRERRTYSCVTMDEITEALEKNGDGFVRAMWCGEEACEDEVKEKTGVGSRCIPFEQEQLSDKCVCCGKPAKYMVYWGKAY